MTGETDDGDARMLAKLWLGWVTPSAVFIMIGVGVKTALWANIGKSIVMVGLLSFLLSTNKLIRLLVALKWRWKFVVFGVFGIMVVVLGFVLYRYVPFAFDILIRLGGMVGIIWGTAGVCMLGEAVFEKIRADPGGDT